MQQLIYVVVVKCWLHEGGRRRKLVRKVVSLIKKNVLSGLGVHSIETTNWVKCMPMKIIFQSP